MIKNFGLIMFAAMIPIVIGVIVAIKNDKKKRKMADITVRNTKVNWAFLFIRHLGFAAMIFITAYAFLFRDIPFPYNTNRFAVWGITMLICIALVAGSLVGEKTWLRKNENGKS